MIDQKLFLQLKETLSRSWLKRDSTQFNSASVAITSEGSYFSGLMESRTHLLDVTSEHAALAQATSCKDAHVTKIITVVDGEYLVNPIITKLLADHTRRTGTTISYEVYDVNGTKLYSLSDSMSTNYVPPLLVLDKLSSWKKRTHCVEFDPTQSVEEQLRECAQRGMQTHFSSNSFTAYGAAVLAGNKIYFAGVYSSFDRRLNLHSEMVAALNAIADGNRNITHVGVISNKFIEEPVHMCGCCRQFFSELQQKTGMPITCSLFSFDGKVSEKRMLSEYLPSTWESGLSIKDRK